MPQRVDLLLATGLGLGGFLVYLRTLAPSILPGDAGEFQFAVPLLGIVHPTGYPLYLILGKAFTLLVPLGDAAYRLNLLSAALAAATVAVVYMVALCLNSCPIKAAARHSGHHARLGALLAALSLAFSRTFWLQATQAEVYALNSFFVATIFLLLALATGPQGEGEISPRPSSALPQVSPLTVAFCYGLSLAHHRTMLLLAPAIGLYLWWQRERLFPAGRHLRLLAGSVILLALPLFLYLYIPLRAPATPYLRLSLTPERELLLYDNTLAAFWQQVSGSGFGNRLGISGSLQERLLMAGNLLWQQFGPVGTALGLLGALMLPLAAISGQEAPAREGLSRFALLSLSYISIVAFALSYSIGDIADFFTPSYLIFALWIGLGATYLIALAPRQIARTALISLLLLALPFHLLVANFRPCDRSQDDTRQRWEAMLRQAPQGAILLSNDRDEMTPMWYLQYVEGQRPDLLGLFPAILPEPGFANIVRLLDTVLETGRPLYLIKPMPGLEIRYPWRQEGLLYRVEGPVQQVNPQRPAMADLEGQALLLGADVEAGPGSETLTVTLYWQGTGAARRDYDVFVHLINAKGDKVAQSDHRPGGDFYPTTLWQAGEVLRDEHRLPIPTPGLFRILVGMYHPGGRLPVKGGGDSIDLGEVRF